MEKSKTITTFLVVVCIMTLINCVLHSHFYKKTKAKEVIKYVYADGKYDCEKLGGEFINKPLELKNYDLQYNSICRKNGKEYRYDMETQEWFLEGRVKLN